VKPRQLKLFVPVLEKYLFQKSGRAPGYTAATKSESEAKSCLTLVLVWKGRIEETSPTSSLPSSRTTAVRKPWCDRASTSVIREDTKNKELC
jgi:hypothetical protein